ncbi:MAG: response regulator [Chloroherpetonaceae bacterium]|nr:response regulator [Chloroherpetonaceae bacterium]
MSSKSTYSVLIVDDNLENCELLKRYLARDTKHTYQVHIALNGSDGLSIARKENPDCILLDHFLPDMDSIEFVTFLREDYNFQHPQIVVITNASDLNSIRKHQSVKSYLKKVSLTPERLHEAVIQSVEQARSSLERNRFEVLYNILFDSSQSAILISDKNGKITSANRACEKLFEKSNDQLRGKSISSLINFATALDYESYDMLFVSASNKESFTHKLRFPDGSTKEIEQTVHFIEESGSRSGMISVLNRIEPKKQIGLKALTNLDSRRKSLRRDSDRDVFDKLSKVESDFRALQQVSKSSLQVTSVLLNLQSQIAKDEKLRQTFQDAVNRAEIIARALDSLSVTDGVASVKMTKYLEKSLQRINEKYSGGKIRLSLKCEDILLYYHSAILSGLVINELIVNAFEHAFPDIEAEGDITVTFGKGEDPGSLSFAVEDNGVGLPDKFDFKQAGSIGLMIVNSLVRQLKGRLEVKRQRGSIFRVTFRDKFSVLSENLVLLKFE